MTNIGHDSPDFSPIVLFAFNRPDHLAKTLSALSKNPEFNLSPLFIYCDGAKNTLDNLGVYKTRKIANQFPHPNKTIIESEINKGLAKSVISGVTEIIKAYGEVIVLEDDLVVDKSFLNFLNQALIRYKNVPKVMQISAYMFSIPEFLGRSETLLLTNVTSWGWATWSHAWEKFDPNATGWELLLSNKDMRREFDVDGSYEYSDMLFRQKKGKIDSWAIYWNWSVYRHSGLVVYPPVTLVKNIGFDGSGTHSQKLYFNDSHVTQRMMPIKFSDKFYMSKADNIYIKAALKKMSGPFYLRILKLIANTFRRLKIKYTIKYWY